MLQNYISIAVRNFYRNGFYSFINVAGLATGIACSILILLWVADEISFDRFHSNYQTIHKVYLNQEYSGEIITSTSTPYPLKEALKTKSEAVKRTVITNHGEGNLLSVGDRKLNKLGMAVSEDFLTMFSFAIVKGDKSNPLGKASSMAITESTAMALFGNEDPIGKLITIDNERELIVAAVLADIPLQSTFQFDYLLPFSYLESSQEWVRETRENWRNNSFNIYAELQTSASPEAVEEAIGNLVKDNAADRSGTKVFLHPMSNWRLYSDYKDGKQSGGMIEYVRLFTGIAGFILLIACVNFMNLATARSEKRAREVGIRKSVGSRRRQLVFQFLGESILITFFSFLLALMIVELTLHPYNLLVNKQLSIPYTDPLLWAAALGLVILTGIIAGSYPAFFLSGFLPAKVLKGKLVTPGGAATPRRVLVILQFGFSIFLLIGTMVVYQQIIHVKNRDVGYDRENLMLIWSNSELEKNYPAIKAELLRTGIVKSVTKSSSPVTRIFSSADVRWPGKDPEVKVGFVTVATEYDYSKTIGIRMTEGRDFSPEFPSDTSAIILNQAAADLIGNKDLIGSQITIWGDERTVIGIMENVVMGSPYVPVDPMAVVYIPTWSSTVNVRLEKTEDLNASISTVEGVFKNLNPSFPLLHRFADDEFEKKFSSINLISRLAGIFSSLAIMITCLGLFGLAAFTAEQRKKEFGIRKVMGASVAGLITLISKDFSRMIIVAFLIAAPLAWWALNRFLEQYPYRIHIAWWIIPLAGTVSLALGMIIVSTQAFRSARSNPVEALRSE